MNHFLLGAAVLAALIVAVHLFAGGRDVARPLLQSTELDDTVRFTLYYCWHLVSITLVMMFLGFAAAALSSSFAALGLAATAFSVAFAAYGVWLAPKSGQGFGKMPQGLLFIPQSILGLIGLFS